MRSCSRFILLTVVVGCGLVSPVGAASIEEHIAAVRAVGPEGRGNREATRAWRELARVGSGELVALLGALDGANDLAANWLRSAIDTVVEHELRAGGAFPVDALIAYLREVRHEPRARRLAWEIVDGIDPERAARLLPGMLEDPSLELRRDAVGLLVAQGDALAAAGDGARATAVYRQALGHARDRDQLEHLSKALGTLGAPVDLPRLFGFVMDWMVAGPFDNTGRKGFDIAFAPEIAADLSSTMPGKDGPVRWQRFRTEHEFGMVDINQVYGALKEVTAYARAEFPSDAERDAELRLGCKNAWKVWANGQLLFSRDEYHRGMAMDQYRLPVRLRPGANVILVKLCQSEQTQAWTKEWGFQLRVCDASGKAIPPAPSQGDESR